MKKTGEYKKCMVCGKEIYVCQSNIKLGRGKYCSQKCRCESRITKVKRICRNCGAEFWTTPSQVSWGYGIYCSRKCRDEKRKNKVERICQFCGKMFYVHPYRLKNSRGKYCSRKCVNESQRGCAGHKHTEETKKRLSESRVKYLSSSKSKGKGKTYDTKIELAFEAQLRANKIKYIKQYNAEGIACVDFFIPEHKIVIQCDGDYWHFREDHKQRDVDQTFRLQFRGYKVFRFLGSEINKDIKKCMSEINKEIMGVY